MVYGRCVGRVSLSGTVNAPGRVGPNSLDKVSFRPGLVYGYFRDLGLFCLVTQRLSTISRVPEGSSRSAPSEVSLVSKTARATQEKMKAGGHMPFEEFPLKEVDQLVHELDKVKPAGSTVIVTPMEDSHHSPCLKEMIAVMVHTAGIDDQPGEIHSIYQHCPKCRIAVRVL